MPLITHSRHSGNVEILTLSGRLTLGDATAAFRETTRKLFEGGSDILVDVSGVDYMDSAGLGELVAAYASASSRGRQMKLLRPVSKISQLLHVTKLYSTFEIFEDEAEALASFSKTSVANSNG